jgi:PAS domain S-box-containing protein
MPQLRKVAKALETLDRTVHESGSPAPVGESARDLAGLRVALEQLVEENGRLRVEAEDLRQKEAHFRELFNATYDGIFLVDIERERIIDANEPALRLVGYTREELGSMTIADLHPYEVPHFLEFARQVVSHGRWQTHELTCRAKWGELIPAQLSATPVYYDGRPCLLVLVHDMRDHRLAKLGLAVSKIGHDLRNILATTQLLSDRLADSQDPETRRIAPRLVQSVDRAIALCAETLKHGRADAPPPRYDTCELRPLVDDVAVTANLGEAPAVAWHNGVPANFKLRVDPDHLFRVLLNLVRNARQVLEGADGGEIRVSAARHNGTVHIDVADTGPGVPDAVRARLFEPFANFGRPDSTGLGLVIARELMRAQDGDVVLAKSDHTGTIFRLEVPDWPAEGRI